MNKFLVKHPIISERATEMGMMGKYIFLVAKEANKPEIKKAIEGIYRVNVEKVHVINAKAKPRRMGRYQGVRPGYRKAIVTLKKGQKLDILPH